MQDSHDKDRDKEELEAKLEQAQGDQKAMDELEDPNNDRRPNRPNRRLSRHAGRTSGVLPLVPLRGMVIYPGVLLSFDLGREQSVRALRQAMAGRHELILSSQTTLEPYWPAPDQIHRVATRVFIRQVLELPDNTSSFVKITVCILSAFERINL